MEPSPQLNTCVTVLLTAALNVNNAESMALQFLKMVCPPCVIVPNPPPIEAKVTSAFGSALTSMVPVNTLGADPGFVTVKVTVVVGAVAVL